MFAQRSILILAFVLTGTVMAAAQSAEPGQNTQSAEPQSQTEPIDRSTVQSPNVGADQSSEPGAPSGEAAAQPAQVDPSIATEALKQAEGQAEPKTDLHGVDNKADVAPPENAPEAARTETAPEAVRTEADGAVPATGDAAGDTSSGEKEPTNAAAPASEPATEAATQSDANGTTQGAPDAQQTPDGSSPNDAATASPVTPEATSEPHTAGDTPLPAAASPTEAVKEAAPAIATETRDAAQTPAPAQQPTLEVATGGGAFAQAYKQVVLEPFAAKTGIVVSDATEDGRTGDLLLLDGAELARGCASGDLITLELSTLNPAASTSELSDDYLDGAVKPCGIAALAWSNLFVYNPDKFEKRTPRTIADVFDTRRFPGKRALPQDGRGLVEALLVADGIAPNDVYSVLETSDGITRVLKRLKSLGANIDWYENLPDAIALVRDGKATFAFTSSGHAFIEQARSGPLGFIWDGQVLHPSYFAIPKSASDAAGAKELVAFASRPEQLAGLVRQIPYGPMRRSAIAGAVGVRHAVTGQEVGPYLPTAPENLRTAVRFDPVWWNANSDRIGAAMRIARQGPPLPARP